MIASLDLRAELRRHGKHLPESQVFVISLLVVALVVIAVFADHIGVMAAAVAK
jgi:hypothetical protein